MFVPGRIDGHGGVSFPNVARPVPINPDVFGVIILRIYVLLQIWKILKWKSS